MNNKIEKYMNQMGENASKALDSFSSIESDERNKLISDIGLQLNANRQAILQSNEADVRNANKKNLARSNIDRLFLDDQRIDSMIHSIEEVVSLPDPIGETIEQWTRPN